QRTVAIGIFAFAMAVVLVAYFGEGKDGRLGSETILGVPYVLLAGSVVVVAVLRRTLLQNAFGRRAVGAMIASVAGLCGSRTGGITEHLSLPHLIVQDLVLLGAFVVATSIMLLVWLWPMAAVIVAAIAVCVARPDLAGLALIVTTAVFPPAIGFALF